MQIIYKKNKRSKNIRITIQSDQKVLVSYPFFVSQKIAQEFVLKKKEWIEKTAGKIKKKGSLLKEGSRRDYLLGKEKARRLVYEKIKYFNRFYDFEYKRIAIRDVKTRWGSCSQKGNLNFSYRIIHLPENLVDYLIVHELCHLGELNHSKKFWDLVGKTIPNYKILSRKLRRM